MRLPAFCALACLGIVSTRTAHALEASDFLIFNKGPVSLRPQLDVQESYNDNVFYRNAGVIGDVLNQTSLGMVLQLGDVFGDNRIRLEYNYDIVTYLENKALDANQQRVKLTSQFAFGKFDVSGLDSFEQIATPLAGGISSGGAKVQRASNSDTWVVGFRISEKTRAYTRLSFSRTDYEPVARTTLFDQTSLSDTMGLDWKPLSKTTFFTEAQYGVSWLDLNAPSAVNPPSTRSLRGSVGARNEFTSKLRGSLQVGYESRTFSDGSPAGTSPTVDLKLTDTFSEKTSGELSYTRSQSTSVQFDRTSYASDTFQISLLQLLSDTGRLRMQVSGGMTFNSFEPSKAVPNRSDQIYSASVVLQYSIKAWLVAYASYSHDTFLSDLPPGANNISLVDYDLNRITIGLSVGY